MNMVEQQCPLQTLLAKRPAPIPRLSFRIRACPFVSETHLPYSSSHSSPATGLLRSTLVDIYWDSPEGQHVYCSGFYLNTDRIQIQSPCTAAPSMLFTPKDLSLLRGIFCSQDSQMQLPGLLSTFFKTKQTPPQTNKSPGLFCGFSKG